MAASVNSQLPKESDPAPARRGRGRRALKQKNPSTNEANILAGNVSEQSPTPALSIDPQKENSESLSGAAKKANTKGKSRGKKQQDSSFERELLEMQKMMEKMKIEKEKTEEILKEKNEMLRMKEEEVESKAREQQKLQIELKKLQKMKEFKPNVTFPTIQSLGNNDLEKKDKKKKGGAEIKRPTPAYGLWCRDQWIEIKKVNPDADFKEVSNMLGAKWKTITPDEKKPYEDKYKAERDVYLQVISKEKRESEAMKLLEEEHKQKTAMELLEQYLQFKQESGQEENKKKKRKEKDPLKPKKPMGAFFLFTNERRPALLGEGKNLCEVSKIMGEEWKNMTDRQKKPYEEKAKENKEAYMQEMEAYKQEKEEEAANLKKEEEELMKIHKHEALILLKKKEKTDNMIKKTKDEKKKNKKDQEKNNDPNKPKRPPSSYILFSKELRKNLTEERPGISNSTINALISVKWKELSEEEKHIWNDKAAESMEAYKKEMEGYNNICSTSAASS